MALTLKYTPSLRYMSAHGDIVFTILEDTKPFNSSTYPDYKYICDVYVNGTQVARLKSFPRPGDKLGVFSIGNVVRSYITTTFAPTPGAVLAQKLALNDFYVNVTCNFGEEYGFTTYTNMVVDSQRSYFNHYDGRLSGVTSNLVALKDKVISNRPYATPVTRNCTYNLIPFLASDDSSIDLVVSCYTKWGSFVRQSTITSTPTPGSIDEIQQYNVSPAAINAAAPGTIDDVVGYYTIGFITPNISQDSVYRFDVICEAKYTVQTLHFLNQWGGFETKEFVKVSRKTYTQERQSYGKPSYVVNSNGSVSWYNSSSNVYNEQVSTYAVSYDEKMQLNSDLLTDAEYRWLKDLVLSPMVYFQAGSYLYPVTIATTDYEEKKIINDSLTGLNINIQFGERFNTQYR